MVTTDSLMLVVPVFIRRVLRPQLEQMNVNNERLRLLATVLSVYAARGECRYRRGASEARFPS
jgi:hypothetical protein